MSGHDATAANPAPANVVAGPREERAETVLHRLEAHMAKSRLRGHIYLTGRTVVEFATRQKRTDRPLERNVGPAPVRRALAEILRGEEEPERWLTRLRARAAGQAPAPALWNSPALVVTGAMASRALCAALEYEADYPAETIDRLMQEADMGGNEVAAMFEEVTGKPLRARVGAGGLKA